MTLPFLLLTIFIVAVSLPGAWLQLFRVQRAATAEGLSVIYLAIGTTSAVDWFMYGITAGQPLQLLVNGGGIVAGVLTLLLVSRMVPSTRSVLFAVLASSAALILIGLVFGSTPLGTIGAATGILCRVPQAIRSWREPGGSGVSVSSFTSAGLSATGWLVFAISRMDPFILVSASVTILLSAWVVYRTVAFDADEPVLVQGLAQVG